jgi:hypothetical protein
MKQVICDNADKCDLRGCPYCRHHDSNDDCTTTYTRHGITMAVKCAVVASKGKKKKG